MLKLSIPGGPRVRWGSRRTSRVMITHRLNLPGGQVRYDLDLPRECFDKHEVPLNAMEALGTVIAEGLPRVRARAGTVTFGVRISSGRRARMTIDHASVNQ